MEQNKMNEHFKIWDELFGKNEYVFDFANNLIVKDEFKTNKPYSWDIDYYDYNDDKFFIASQDLIKERDKKPFFIFNNIKYFVTKNLDFTYSIINQNKISNKDNPFNYDLVAINKINNIKAKNIILLSIVYKKLKLELNDTFISFLNEAIELNFLTKSFKLDLLNEFKTKIVYKIDLNQISLSSIMINIIKIPIIINIILFRLKQKYRDIWYYPETNNLNNFNICLFSKLENSNLSIWEQNDKFFLNFLETLEDKVLLNQNLVNDLIKEKFNANKFTRFFENENNNVYLYNFINTNFLNYFLSIKKK